MKTKTGGTKHENNEKIDGITSLHGNGSSYDSMRW